MRKMRSMAGLRMLLASLACCMLLLSAIACGAQVAGSAGADDSRLPAESIFDRHRLWEAHIRISAEAWKRMQPEQAQPAARGMLGNLLRGLSGAAPATRLANAEYERRTPNHFGMEYTYVRGVFEFNGEIHTDVGIRFKGASSYSTARQSLKRPLKIDFNRFIDDQEFHGLQQINLHNNACDPSQIREALSYWAFREAGIPAPRTSFVLLYLTVEGEHDRVCLGVYTLVEEVDRRFLKSRFGTKDGLLIKPEAGQLPYRGDDWSQYFGFQPRTDGNEEEIRRIIELARIIHRESGEGFSEKIDQVVDVDQFLQYVAVNGMIANLDSILAIDHNFYLYAPPDRAKIVWLPWDMNLTWGAYQRLGGWDELMELSIRKPWAGSKPLLDKVLAVDEWREAYMAHVGRLTRTALNAERVRAEVDAMEVAVRDADCRAAGAILGGNPSDLPWTPSWKKPPSPGVFAERRWTSLDEQLGNQADAADIAYVPRFRTGGLQRGSRPHVPAPPGVAEAVFAAIDANGDGRLGRDELTEAALALLFAPADAAGMLTIRQADVVSVFEKLKLPERQNERTRGRRSTRPANAPASLASTLLYEADRNLDGQITRPELCATVARLLHENDMDDDGQLDSTELAGGLGRFLTGW